MAELPENWGYAEFEIYSVENLDDRNKPTVVDLKLVGFIRGIDFDHSTKLVCDSKSYDDLAEEIAYNVLYPWVESIIYEQNAGVIL